MQTLFNKSPWLRNVALGQVQTAPKPGMTCERTPEGGMRCSDGTYLPPGCQAGSPNTVAAAPPGTTSIWPYVAAAGVLAAGAAAYALGDPASFENAYPAAAADLRAIAGKITGERAADAWNFTQMQEAGKKKYDLLAQAKIAEDRLRNEEKLWEQSHKNADALQAATAEVDRLATEISAANDKVNEYRGYVNANADNIMRYRQDAEAIISRLPEESKLDARLIIDPCVKGQSMSGMPQLRMGLTAGMVNDPNKTFKLPAWKPNLGQTAVTPTPPGTTPAAAPVSEVPSKMVDAAQDFVRANGPMYAQGALFGGVLGLGTDLAFPSGRLSRKEGLTLMGVGTAVSVIAGIAKNMGVNPSWMGTLIGLGGAFTGNGLASVILPKKEFLPMIERPLVEEPMIAGWRRRY